MQKDATKQDEVKQLADQFAQAQAQQDAAAGKVKQLQDQEIQANSKGNMQDLEFQHDKRMKDQEFQFTQAIDNLKLEKATNQTAIAHQKAEEKHQQDVAHTEQDQGLKVQDKQIDINAKQKQKELDIAAQQTKNSMADIQAQKKAAEPATQTA